MCILSKCEALRLRALICVVALFVPALASAQTQCGSLSDYEVVRTNFTNRSVLDAIKTIVGRAPFTVEVQGVTGMTVTAHDIAGPLDHVIGQLATQGGWRYEQRKCTIVVIIPGGYDEPETVVGESKGEASPAVESWELKKNTSIRSVVESWASKVGWQVVWKYKDDLTSPVDITFKGDFRAAIRQLIDGLPHSIPLRAELRPDNVPPLVYVHAEGVSQ